MPKLIKSSIEQIQSMQKDLDISLKEQKRLLESARKMTAGVPNQADPKLLAKIEKVRKEVINLKKSINSLEKATAQLEKAMEKSIPSVSLGEWYENTRRVKRIKTGIWIISN